MKGFLIENREKQLSIPIGYLTIMTNEADFK